MNAALSAGNVGKFPLAAVVPTPRRDFYGQALRRLCLMCPDRAFVCSIRGRGHVAIEGTYGIRRQQTEVGPSQMDLLNQVLRTGVAIVRDQEGWTACLPVKNSQGRVKAILYAECSIPLLSRADLDELLEWTQTVGTASLQSSGKYGPLGQRKMAVLMRSLATMVEAGVPLHRALIHLARTASEPATSALCSALSNDVQRGIPLSQAASRHPIIFSSLHVGLLHVGEVTGRLSTILQSLATYDERRLQTTLKLRKALTYPAVLLAICFLALLLAPPLLLERHFELIRALHVEVPVITQLLMGFSDLMRTPWPYVLLFGLALSGRRLLARAWASPRLVEKLLTLPRLGSLVRTLLTARFSRALALQLETAVPVTQALELSGSASGNALMNQVARRAAQSLIEGDTLTRSLERTGFFTPLFLNVMRCGEETGDVARLANWLADLGEDELDRSIELVESLLEPLIVAFLGGVVALMILATMLPLTQALGSL